MRKITKVSIAVFFVIALAAIAAAIDFNPNGNIEMRKLWSINNATNISASYFNGLLGSYHYLSNFSNNLNISGNWTADKILYSTTIEMNTAIATNNISVVGKIDSLSANLSGDISGRGNWTADKPSYSTTVDMNTAIKNSNDSMRGYVNEQNASVTSYATSLNTSMKGYVDALLSVLSGDISGRGNWTADKGSYSTTAQANLLYALISEPIASSLGNWSADRETLTLNLSKINNSDLKCPANTYMTTFNASAESITCQSLPTGLQNLNMNEYNITNTSSVFYSNTTSAYAWRTYVNASNSFIIEVGS
jgi:hypothetical protein